MTKVKFVATAIAAAEGEAEVIDEDNGEIFIAPVQVVPVVVIVGGNALTTTILDRVREMAIHQVLIQATALMTPKNTEIGDQIAIPMSPKDEDKN